MRRAFVLPAVLLLALAVALPAIAGRPLFLWTVKGPQATVAMTGSIHVGRPEFFPLAAPLEQAFRDADALGVEVDVDDPAVQQEAASIVFQRGMLPGDETLESRLGKDVWTRLQAYADSAGVPLALYNKVKPGIVAMVLAMNEYQRQGYDPALGVDKHFLDAAHAEGKPVRSLETIAAQMELFLQVDDKLDDVLMDEMLDQMADLKEETERMIALWRAGDADGLERYMAEQVGDDPEMQDFYRKLLDDRNVAMADSLDSWLHGDQDVFVVVGAGHFGGDQGLVKLLEAKGWDVKQAEE